MSFDVTALYTSLPINRTLEIVVSLLEDENSPCLPTTLNCNQIVELLELCLRSTFFSFQERFYKLEDGVAMGSPVSSVVANIFMMNFERKALGTATYFEPRLWRRYVDDVYSIIKKLRIEGLLAHINSIDGNIRFTLERECDRGLPFLDVKVNREEGGQLRTAVYRKATYTNQILNFQSHHSTSAKTSVVRSLMDGLDTHFETEDEEGRNAEKEKIMKTLELNGYPRCFVKQVEIKKKKARADKREKKITAHNREQRRYRLSVPYIQGLSESIARVLGPIGIDVAHRANLWKWRLCKAIKDKLSLSKRKGVVYCIECNDCECIYILGKREGRLKIASKSIRSRGTPGWARLKSPQWQSMRFFVAIRLTGKVRGS